MKIKSPIGFLALWSAFLAAGTWALPPSALLLTPRSVEASYPSDDSNPSEFWVGTEIAHAWLEATGRAYNPQSELILVAAGSPDAPVRLTVQAVNGDTVSEVDNSAVDWLPLGSLELNALVVSDSDGDPTFQSGESATIAVTPRLVVGSTVVADRAPRHFLGLSLAIGVTQSGPSETSELGHATVMLPMFSFASADLAVAALGRAEAAISGSGSGGSSGGSGIHCVNPDWIGHNGVQCCDWKERWDDDLAGCRSQFWNDFWHCFLISGASVLVAVAGCLASKCKWMPPLPPQIRVSCTTGCIAIVGGLGLIGAGFACYNYARSKERDCERDTNRYYQDMFVELGCSLKPGGSQSAIVEILEEQKLQQGEQLEPAVID